MEGRLEMTPSVTMSCCGFRPWAHILTHRSLSPFFLFFNFSTMDLLLPSHNKLLWRAGEMLLPVSVTAASQISLGGHGAGGQQINGFRHKSISTLRVWSVYWAAPPAPTNLTGNNWCIVAVKLIPGICSDNQISTCHSPKKYGQKNKKLLNKQK